MNIHMIFFVNDENFSCKSNTFGRILRNHNQGIKNCELANSYENAMIW